MNETIDLLNAHRSVRRFGPDPIPDEHVRIAVEAGQRASTSSAVQAYSLLRVTDAEERRALVELTGGQPQVADAGAFFIVCGDARRHRLLLEQDDRDYTAGLEGFLVSVIDATLFAQNTVIAFESMGYGVCYIGGLRNDLAAVDALLDLPDGLYPLYGLCVGVPAEPPADAAPRPRLPMEAVLCEGRFPVDAAVLQRVAEYDRGYEAYLRDRSGGKKPAGPAWSDRMRDIHGAPRRPNLAEYYASKGAELG